MERRPARTSTERKTGQHAIPWRYLDHRPSSAFVLAGVLLLGSVLAPVGLEPLTDWYWTAGLVLVGAGVVSAAVGLVGLYPLASDRIPRLALLGLLCAAIAGITALGVILMVAIAIVTETAGVALATPMDVFAILALSMAGGLSLGFLSFGVAIWRTRSYSRTAGGLLALGGGLLLVPTIGEVLRMGFGIGPPPWALFPLLALFCVDTLLVGYSLRSESVPPE